MKSFVISICALLFTVITCAQQAKSIVKPVTKPAVKLLNAVNKTFANGITMNIKGFKVAEAGLYFEDGSKVPENNMVELNQKIVMYAVVDSGFKIINGKVYPGSSQRIVLSSNYEVLKTGDLFASYEKTGVDAADAKYISLKAVMTELTNKSDIVIVTFKIWDKSSTSVITGSYKFRIK